MRRWSIVRKTFHGLLSVLYLSLSLYTISCAFHHDPLTDLHVEHHPAHGQQGGAPQDPAPEEGLLCKFVQKVTGSVVLVSNLSVSWMAVAPHEALPTGLSVLQVLTRTYSSRAPPILFV